MSNVLTTMEGHDGQVVDVEYVERDGAPTVVTAGQHGTVRFWDPTTGEQLGQLDAHTGEVYAMDVSPEGGRLVTSGADGTARVWDLETLDGIVQLGGDPTRPPYAVALDPDGERLAVGGFDGTVTVYDARTGEQVLTYAEHQPDGAGQPAQPGRRLGGHRDLTDDERRRFLEG